MRTFYSFDGFLTSVLSFVVSDGKASSETIAHSVQIAPETAEMGLDMLTDQGKVARLETGEYTATPLGITSLRQ